MGGKPTVYFTEISEILWDYEPSEYSSINWGNGVYDKIIIWYILSGTIDEKVGDSWMWETITNVNKTWGFFCFFFFWLSSWEHMWYAAVLGYSG